MNFRICFIVAVLWHMALTEAARPLAVYYDFMDKKYVLTKPQETSLVSDLLLEDDPERPAVIYCCPAETEEQQSIQEDIDEDVKNKFQALFVKQKTNPNDANENIVCAYEYAPSASSEADNEILIGYAIHEYIDNDINWPTQNRSYGDFIWIFEKQIKYNFATRGDVRSIHYIYPNQHTNTATCHNYDLGSNIIPYNTDDFQRFYDRKNQNTVFEDVDRPGTGEQYDVDVIMNRRTSGLLNRRPKPRTEIVRREVLEEVVMHQLIPIEDFKEEHLKKETCSYVNTTPIWDSIHKGSLKNVEQYIRGIADKLPPNNSLKNRLRVRTIVGEQFTDKKKNAVDLDVEKHRYPVYRQLVKIISYLYSPLESNEPQEKYRQESLQKYENPNKMHLHIAIVIHNELGPPESTLCRVNMCGQLGWHVASIEGGLTYCCSLNELKYTDLVTSEGIPDNSKPFDLNEILPEGANPAPPVAKVRGTYPAVIVLYYPQEGTYKYADFKQLQTLDLQINNELQFTDILLYCPPETTDEKVSASLLKVDLMFVRKIVQIASDIRNRNICANRYKPVVWRNNEIHTSRFYFGYLVSEHEASMRTQPLSKSPEKWQPEYRGVALFSIHYYPPIYSEHVLTARKQTTDSYDLCENDMQLGLENIKFANENTFVNAYDRQNQIDKLNYQYDSSKYYFVKKQLIPVDDFDDDGHKLATCSYMNIYPVWNFVHKALLGVENYLRKILNRSRFIDKLYIRTRLIGTLELPARPTKSPTQKNATQHTLDPDSKEVYLDAGQIINVPACILKIIGHRVPLPQKEAEHSSEIEYKYYFMAMMFENSMNHTFAFDDECVIVECINYGWDVAEWDWPGNHPYCCELDAVKWSAFKLPFTAREDQYEIFDLNHVVIKLDENGVPAEHENIAKLVNHVKTGLEVGTD